MSIQPEEARLLLQPGREIHGCQFQSERSHQDQVRFGAQIRGTKGVLGPVVAMGRMEL